MSGFFNCIKFIALMALCCVSIKYGHWLLAFFMLVIGGAYCGGDNNSIIKISNNINEEKQINDK